MALSDNEFIKYNLENAAQLQKIIKSAADRIGDLRFAFGEISRDFYKSQKAIFQLKGPGGYKDLNPTYKTQKKNAVGFAYPILKRSGKMARAATNPQAPGAINKISKKELLIGASRNVNGVDVAEVHNSDAPRKKIPQRKFIFIGPEVSWFHQRDRQQKGGRLTRWGNIIEGYAQEVLKNRGLG